MGKLAIKIGNATCTAAISDNGMPVMLSPAKNSYCSYGFPSVVFIDENRNLKVCQEATSMLASCPERFFQDFVDDIHNGDDEILGVSYASVLSAIITHITTCAKKARQYDVDGLVFVIPDKLLETDPFLSLLNSVAQGLGIDNVTFIQSSVAAVSYLRRSNPDQLFTHVLVYDVSNDECDISVVQYGDNGHELLKHVSVVNGLTDSGELQVVNTFPYCDVAVRQAGIEWNDIDAWIVTGHGSDALPISSIVKKHLISHNVDIPILQATSSDKGLLYADCLGALVQNQESLLDGVTAYDLGCLYYEDENLKHWGLAAYYFNIAVQETGNQDAYDKMLSIYEYLYDNMEIDGNQITVSPILESFGVNSADFVVDLILALQEQIEELGEDLFYAETEDIEFWTNIFKLITEKQIKNKHLIINDL